MMSYFDFTEKIHSTMLIIVLYFFEYIANILLSKNNTSIDKNKIKQVVDRCIYVITNIYLYFLKYTVRYAV